jgi:hypothetical protein
MDSNSSEEQTAYIFGENRGNIFFQNTGTHRSSYMITKAVRSQYEQEEGKRRESIVELEMKAKSTGKSDRNFTVGTGKTHR